MAVFLDVNSRVGFNGKPEIVTDYEAIQNSLYNLFKTPLVSEKYLPDYGCNLESLLQEPTSAKTAREIYMDIRAAVEKWEPRILFDPQNSFVVPNYTLPGYDVQVSFIINKSQVRGAFPFSAASRM